MRPGMAPWSADVRTLPSSRRTGTLPPMARRTNYDKHPCVRIDGFPGHAARGTMAVLERLRQAVASCGASCRLVVDCYPGVDEAWIQDRLIAPLAPRPVVRTGDARLPQAELERLFEPNLTDDRVFGVMSHHDLEQCFDAERLEQLRHELAESPEGLTVVVGHGAALFCDADILVYADMPRWEIQQRLRHGALSSWGMENEDQEVLRRYKHGYFVEWRLADRHKAELFDAVDLFLDTTVPADPRLATGEAIRAGLAHTATRPFRVVPLFDPAPWGGQWMKAHCGLDPSVENYGWCFDCVPEENSLVLEIDGVKVEFPALDLVLTQPRSLLGDAVHARFGAEFPIRFDFLDTIGGGNLSYQVHPLTKYVREAFGMPYTQDESYYLLDAEEGATVYLGLKAGADQEELAAALRAAQSSADTPFDAERFAARWPAKKHDHFLIPAGTPHGSGAGSMVLEISATPYIFTFKLWDWGRLGLDGQPRPIHLDHGLANIQWERDEDFVRRELVNHVVAVQQGDGWREERTGLHPLEFIETRRHWFTKPVPHDTDGGVNVLNLVEGDAAVVESPSGAFTPFEVHYAETFIVPAAVGQYVVRPLGSSPSGEHATMKAYVRV